jgi:hypothetical protein
VTNHVPPAKDIVPCPHLSSNERIDPDTLYKAHMSSLAFTLVESICFNLTCPVIEQTGKCHHVQIQWTEVIIIVIMIDESEEIRY